MSSSVGTGQLGHRKLSRRSALPSILGLLLVAGVPVVSSAHAGGTSNRGTSPSCTSSSVAPTSITPLDGGGYKYGYGALGDYVVPPSGFDPQSATDALLSEYGFPPRPTSTDALNQWNNEMSHYRTTSVPDVVDGCHLLSPAGALAGSTSSSTSADTVTSYNTFSYAGFNDVGSTKSTYDAAQGDFTQPTHGSTDCGSGGGQASWVGLGGSEGNITGALIQGGTAIYGPGAPSEYSAWVELIPSASSSLSGIGPLFDKSMTIHPGDSIHIYVAYSTANRTVDVYIADNTTGQADIYNKSVSSAYYDGSTADWIDELPGGDTKLVDFQHTAWSNGEAQMSSTGSWVRIGGQNRYKLTLIMNYPESKGYRILAAPSDLNSAGDGFTDTWYACES